jgi:hypothetical protein
MESAIHALSRSETAQAEPNAATTMAIAEAPAQRDRFSSLPLNPDDTVVLQSHGRATTVAAPKFVGHPPAPQKTPTVNITRDQQAGCEPAHSLNRHWQDAAAFCG